MYDIVFSFTVHEHADGFAMTLQNVFDACKDLTVGILIHSNPVVYNELIELHKKHEWSNVWIHPKPFEKGWATFSILQGHLESISYFHTELHLTTVWYCLMASNCMFHRIVPKDIVSQCLSQRKPVQIDSVFLTQSLGKQRSWYWYSHLCRNKKVLAKLQQEKCPIVTCHHEGSLYDAAFLEDAAELLRSWNIPNSLTVQMPFEEFLLPSLYAKRTGFTPASICKVLSHPPELDTLHTHVQVCIKPVPREAANPLRQFLTDIKNLIK